MEDIYSTAERNDTHAAVEDTDHMYTRCGRRRQPPRRCGRDRQPPRLERFHPNIISLVEEYMWVRVCVFAYVCSTVCFVKLRQKGSLQGPRRTICAEVSRFWRIYRILIVAEKVGVISAYKGTLFQVPFVKSMKIRATFAHYGR